MGIKTLAAIFAGAAAIGGASLLGQETGILTLITAFSGGAVLGAAGLLAGSALDVARGSARKPFIGIMFMGAALGAAAGGAGGYQLGEWLSSAAPITENHMPLIKSHSGHFGL